jgi:hypothetical protein
MSSSRMKLQNSSWSEKISTSAQTDGSESGRKGVLANDPYVWFNCTDALAAYSYQQLSIMIMEIKYINIV